jgi:dTDP-6-deoxy-L-talose 4-dehydrogenase (NAD+)
MKILVTGATGFVGNHVVTRLLNLGQEVVATARSRDKARKFEWFNRVLFIPHEISDTDHDLPIFNYFEKPNVLIHLAWDGISDVQNQMHLESNLTKHKKFLSDYISSGGKHLLVTGTCLEYGKQSGSLSEDLNTYPTTQYGKAKNDLRRHLEGLQKQNNSFLFQWVRLFYMFGEGQHPKSIIPQLDAAIKKGDALFNMSGGEQTRDYLPVDLVAEYICKIALQDRVTGIINCCSGNPISIKHLVEKYIISKGVSIRMNLGYYPYTSYEPMHFWGDNTKLKSVEQ